MDGRARRGAVERLSVICAHCNAKLTPRQMDYACYEDRLVPDLRAAFRPLRRDDATNAFLMRSSNRPWAVNFAQSVACTYLRKFMSLTDANAVLGRGKMHVLSREQAEDLLEGRAQSRGRGPPRRRRGRGRGDEEIPRRRKVPRGGGDGGERADGSSAASEEVRLRGGGVRRRSVRAAAGPRGWT